MSPKTLPADDMFSRLRQLERRVKQLELNDPIEGIPDVSPEASAIGGLGYILALWIQQDDAVVYEVHIHDQVDFTPDPETTLYGETKSTFMFIRSLPDGTRFNYTQPYYIKIVAKNPFGRGPDGSESPAVMIQGNNLDISDLSADKITAGSVTSNIVITGLLVAPALTGWRTEMGDATYPLRFWDGTTTRFYLKNDGTLQGNRLVLVNDTAGAALSLVATTSSYRVFETIDASAHRRFQIDGTAMAIGAGSIAFINQALEIGGGISMMNIGGGSLTLGDSVNGTTVGLAVAIDSLFNVNIGMLAINPTGGASRSGIDIAADTGHPTTPQGNVGRLYTRTFFGDARYYTRDDNAAIRLVGQAELLVDPITADVSVANTVTETAVLTKTIPANTLLVGTTYRLIICGTIDNIATSGTLTFRFRWGGVAGVILNSQVRASQVGAGTNQPYWWEGIFTCRTTGATGSAQASLLLRDSFASLTTSDASTTALTIATNASKDLVATIQWATANAGNIFRATQAWLEVIKP